MNNEKPEFILCAAIHYKDFTNLHEDSQKIPVSQYMPTNVSGGIVATGFRHAQCLRLLQSIIGVNQLPLTNHTQGFLTSKNRFVDRYEAAKIAIANNQCKSTVTMLFSEDLY